MTCSEQLLCAHLTARQTQVALTAACVVRVRSNGTDSSYVLDDLVDARGAPRGCKGLKIRPSSSDHVNACREAFARLEPGLPASARAALMQQRERLSTEVLQVLRENAGIADESTAIAPVLCCCQFFDQCTYLRAFLGQAGKRVVCVTEATAAEARTAPLLACGHTVGQPLIEDRRLEALGFYQRAALKTLVHLGDEGAPRTLMSEDQHAGHVAMYASFRHVFRQYWSPFFERRKIAEWTPLGWSVPLAHPGVSGKRKNFVGFYGNNGNNGQRGELLRTFERVTGVHVAGAVMTHAACSSEQDACSEVQRAWYAAQMQDTHLCLQLPGLSAECYRLYESLEAGCVPIFVTDFHPQTDIQHQSLLRGGAAPFLLAARAEDLVARLQLLEADPAALADLHAATDTWWRARREHFRSRLVQEIDRSALLLS